MASAVKTATADATNHRVGWLSFSVPYSWKDMAAGKGDAWAKDLATRMKAVGGPVWVAIAHEPEGEGDMQQWKAMQARIAPIMRAAAPNLGYSIILMGYHQMALTGGKKYALSTTGRTRRSPPASRGAWPRPATATRPREEARAGSSRPTTS